DGWRRGGGGNQRAGRRGGWGRRHAQADPRLLHRAARRCLPDGPRSVTARHVHQIHPVTGHGGLPERGGGADHRGPDALAPGHPPKRSSRPPWRESREDTTAHAGHRLRHRPRDGVRSEADADSAAPPSRSPRRCRRFLCALGARLCLSLGPTLGPLPEALPLPRYFMGFGSLLADRALWPVLLTLAVGAFSLAIVSSLDVLLCARVMDGRTGERSNGSWELVRIGVANIAA